MKIECRLQLLPYFYRHLRLFALLVSFPVSLFAQTLYFQGRTFDNPSQGFLAGLSADIAKTSSINKIFTGLGPVASAGVAFDNEKKEVYFSDLLNNQVRKIDQQGNITIVVSASAGVEPRAISLNTQGNFLFIMDRNAGQILRADLAQTLPIVSVEVVVPIGSFTSSLEDLKFNPVDGHLYWSNEGVLHKAVANADTILPVNPQFFDPTLAASIVSFDFDRGGIGAQRIYFYDSNFSTAGIYSGILPPPSVNTTETLDDELSFDTSSFPSFLINGIALDIQDSLMCYSGSDGPGNFIRCGAPNNVAEFTEILSDTGDGLILAEAPSFLAMAPIPPVVPDPPRIVFRDTVPERPEVDVDLVPKRPRVRVILEKYVGADVGKKPQAMSLIDIIREFRAKNKASRISFRYQVELRKVAKADGSKIRGSKNRDFRRIRSKLNELTIRNLQNNSSYNVRYRVEITRKLPGRPLSVVRRTPFSPSNRFVVQR